MFNLQKDQWFPVVTLAGEEGRESHKQLKPQPAETRLETQMALVFVHTRLLLVA